MALKGSVSVEATPNGRDLLVFSWEAVQDQTARTSTVSWQLQLVADAYGAISGSDVAGSPWAVTVDGEEVTGTSSVVIAANQTKTLASGQKVMTHAEDGTRSFAFSFSQYFGITWVDTEIGYVTGSGTGELDAITGDEPEQPDQPETPEKFPLQDFLNGLAMALCGRPIRWPSREPVAYLYNGARLPKLPEYDQTEYPYAFISVNKNNPEKKMLYVLAVEATHGEAYMGGGALSGNAKLRYDYTDGGAWSEPTDQTDKSILGTSFYTPVWSNYEMLRSNGEVWLSASEPVPVYE